MAGYTQRDLVKEKQWRARLVDWKRSGLTGHSYCEAAGLTYSQFASWKQVINKRDAELQKQESTKRTVGRPRRMPERSLDAERPRAVQFAPIVVVDRPNSEQSVTEPSVEEDQKSRPRSFAGLEIVLAGGLVIRVDSDCRLGFLAQVVSTLEGR